jgi:hypothetical protein
MGLTLRESNVASHDRFFIRWLAVSEKGYYISHGYVKFPIFWWRKVVRHLTLMCIE